MAYKEFRKGKLIGITIKRSYLGPIQQLPDTIKRKTNTKKIVYEMAQIVREHANKYIPENTGKLKDRGYILQLSNSRLNPWFKLSYRNSRAVPYVFYQYYGKVWKNNYPIFEKPEKFNPNDLRMRPMKGLSMENVGWISSKHKTPTEKPFRRKARTFTIAGGRKVKITGYTKNKKAQPEWLEYMQSHDKGPFSYDSEIARYLERVYSAVIAGDKAYVRR